MKLIIAGSRTFQIDASAAVSLHNINNISEVVCGMAPGVDLAGKYFAENDWKLDYPLCSDRPIPVKEFPADWDKHGKAAGPIRNKEMAEYADALLLIWDGSSRGSANMKSEMQKLGKPVYEVIIRKV
jgi:hypothetical protein